MSSHDFVLLIFFFFCPVKGKHFGLLEKEAFTQKGTKKGLKAKIFVFFFEPDQVKPELDNRRKKIF